MADELQSFRPPPPATQTGPAPIFELSDVSLLRQGRHVLDGVDWTVEAGQRWVVLGPNGSGKSSLLSILSTYTSPSRGHVRVMGHQWGQDNMTVLRSRMGYLSAPLAGMIPKRLTVGEIVDAAQVGAVVPWYVASELIDRSRTLRVLGRVGFEPAAAEIPYPMLSSGEQLRVQLARALVAEPSVILFDEPTANLDMSGREMLIATLSDLAAHDAIGAIVLVVHRLEDIPPGFTHAILLRSGRIVARGLLEHAITADTLTDCFGIPVHVQRIGERLIALSSAAVK